MQEFEVTCINKLNRQSSHEHITHIGNAADNWRMTREEAIQRIEAQQERYSPLIGTPEIEHISESCVTAFMPRAREPMRTGSGTTTCSRWPNATATAS